MNRSLTLASSVAGAVIVALDGTVLTVARPALQHDLHASLTEAQWTGTGYLVAVAGLLVFAGRLGDRHGHRRVFAVGMLGFGAVSAALAVAPGVGWVIALRIVQGVFGALLQPATLGMLRASFPPDRLRTPIAVRTAAIGVAAAVGPVVGGALTTGFGWRAVFLVNVVPALLFGALALASREETRPSADAPLDLPGALLLAVTLACLVHTLVTLPGVTWSAPVALLAAVAFVRHERRAPAPLLPSAAALGRTGAGDGGPRPVGAALALLVLASAALNGAVFACVYLLQDGLGLTPLHSALLSLPLAVALVAAAPAAAVLLRRAGARHAHGGDGRARRGTRRPRRGFGPGRLLRRIHAGGSRVRRDDGGGDACRRQGGAGRVGRSGGRNAADGDERRAGARRRGGDRAHGPRRTAFAPVGAGVRGRGRSGALRGAPGARTPRRQRPPRCPPRRLPRWSPRRGKRRNAQRSRGAKGSARALPARR